MATGTAREESGVLQLGSCIDTIIAAGYHRFTDFGRGMVEKDYRRLWPTEVLSPIFQEQNGFGRILLVDRTIGILELLRLGGCESRQVSLLDWTDGVEAPVDSETQLQLARYVVFAQLGERNLGHSADECWKTHAS
ncbi:MAG: hypothetical protein AAB849_00370, partial [Patescibacteria group bacterium]